jgi:hypothetical protein
MDCRDADCMTQMTHEEADAQAHEILRANRADGETWHYIGPERGLSGHLVGHYAGTIILRAPVHPITGKRACYAISISDENLNPASVDARIKEAIRTIRAMMDAARSQAVT